MRLNLMIEGSGSRTGFVNIDPYSHDVPNVIKADLSNLSHTVDDAEASEIVAHEVLDYYPGKMVDLVLDNWLLKICHGGTLTISVVDTQEVAKALCDGNIDIDEVQDLLHGKQERQWDVRKATFTLAILVTVLENKGLKILQKRVRNYRAYVVAQRP